MAESNPRDPGEVEYRDVRGWPGYKVGSDGSVWSCWRRKGAGGGRGSRSVMSHMHWHRLKANRGNKYGHSFVALVPGPKTCAVHRLVLEAFVGPCPDGLEACHNDGDPTNNTPTNLRWDTHAANIADRSKHGKTCRGTSQMCAKLTEEKVRGIRAEYAAGPLDQQQLANKYGVSQSAIHYVVSRQTWKHVI